MNSDKKSIDAPNDTPRVASRPTFLAKIFGFAVAPEEYINGSVSHTMSSDGIAEVNIAALLHSKNFRASAAKLKKIPISPSPAQTQP